MIVLTLLAILLLSSIYAGAYTFFFKPADMISYWFESPTFTVTFYLFEILFDLKS